MDTHRNLRKDIIAHRKRGNRLVDHGATSEIVESADLSDTASDGGLTHEAKTLE